MKAKLRIPETAEFLRSEARRAAPYISRFGWRPTPQDLAQLRVSTKDPIVYRVTAKAWRSAGFPLTARGVEQPANKGWSPERRKQHKAKRGALRAERDARLAQRLKREEYYETTEAEADSFATKLIARSRDLAVDLHELLSVGAELQLMDALSRRLESNDVDPEAAAEKRKAEMAKLEEPANENKIAAEIEGVVNAALLPKRRGRPKGSKNKPKAQAEAT